MPARPPQAVEAREAARAARLLAEHREWRLAAEARAVEGAELDLATAPPAQVPAATRRLAEARARQAREARDIARGL